MTQLYFSKKWVFAPSWAHFRASVSCADPVPERHRARGRHKDPVAVHGHGLRVPRRRGHRGERGVGRGPCPRAVNTAAPPCCHARGCEATHSAQGTTWGPPPGAAQPRPWAGLRSTRGPWVERSCLGAPSRARPPQRKRGDAEPRGCGLLARARSRRSVARGSLINTSIEANAEERVALSAPPMLDSGSFAVSESADNTISATQRRPAAGAPGPSASFPAMPGAATGPLARAARPQLTCGDGHGRPGQGRSPAAG